SRVLALVPVLCGILAVVFLLIRLIPGDAVQLFLGTQVEMTPAQMVELRRFFGVDKPIPAQFVDYLTRIVRGAFGVSLRTAGRVPLGQYAPLSQHPLMTLRSLALPAVALGMAIAAILMRHVRSSLLEVLGQEYIRTAHGKGLRARVVMLRHALPNAMIPVITVLGFQMGYLLGGTVVIEEIFALPGMGRLVLQAIFQRDYPVVQGVVLVIAFLFVLTNLIVDVLYAWIDPRIRYG